MKKINLACIVEDDPVHLFLAKKFLNLTLTGLVEDILVCRNGKEAYDTLNALFLSNRLLPELILLDLNMPVWDGWQFLEEFVKIPITQKVAIYILTSSTSEYDYKKAERYNLKGNYLIKPIDLKQLKEVLESME